VFIFSVAVCSVKRVMFCSIAIFLVDIVRSIKLTNKEGTVLVV
jgi:hypothetical protein